MGFFGHFRKLFLALLLLAVPLFFYLRKGPEPSFLQFFDHIVLVVSSPLVRGVRFVKNSSSQLLQNYIILVETHQENERLQQQIDTLQLQQAHCEAVSRNHERLTELLHFQSQLPLQTLAAQVLAYPPLGEFKMLQIDRGKQDGVQRGDAVIAPEGLVGRIFRVDSHLAQVLLLTDPTSAVDARVVRTGARGLVVGKGKRVGLKRELFIGAFEFWDRFQEVAEGDQLVTSGLDEAFPPDLPIGKVRQVRRGEYEVFLEGELLPAVDFNKLREVLIVQRR